MSDESPQERRVKELWQSQPTEGVHMSIDQIRLSAGKFERRIRGRNTREYATAIGLVVFFSFELWRAGDLLVRIGFGLIIAGLSYLIWHLLSKGTWRALPEDAGLSSCVEFQRRQLAQQRDLLASVWRWYLGPLIPGMAVLLFAFGRANPGHLTHPALVVVPEGMFFVAISVAIATVNGRAARRLQRQIDELEQGGREG